MRNYFLLLSFLLLSTICYAQQDIPSRYYTGKFQDFYQHPSSTLLTDIITAIDNDTTASANPTGQASSIGFLVAAFEKFNSIGTPFQKLAGNLKHSKALVQYSLMLSQRKDTILNWVGHSPSINDLRWGAFFASGDTRYLSKLVYEMEYYDRDDSLKSSVTVASAKWSLCSNAIQFSEVKHYLESAKDTCNKYLQAQIEETLQSSPGDLQDKMIEKVKLFKNKFQPSDKDSLHAQIEYQKNGLRLHIALTNDHNFFGEWQKSKKPKISSVGIYTRGDNVFPIIIFSTDGKDENGNADLTYDIKIFKPDGSVYSNFEQLEIWKDAWSPTLHLVKQPINIRIKNSDQLGVYKVHVVVYENNKKTNVAFDLSFKVIG
jgi:hypothetical protein